MGPSFSNKPGQITNLAKTSSSFIHFAPYRSHVIPLFNQYNILPLNFQYRKSVCTIMHDLSNISLPASISNLFLYPTQVHSYIILGFQGLVVLFIITWYSRTNQLKQSFSRFCARIWNSIPQSTQVLPKYKFKASSHQLVLRILKLEDSHVDTPALVNMLSKMIWNVK